MVEMLSARLQDVYNKWESRSEPRIVPNAQHLTYTGLRRLGYQQRQKKRMLVREASREVCCVFTQCNDSRHFHNFNLLRTYDCDIKSCDCSNAVASIFKHFHAVAQFLPKICKLCFKFLRELSEC